MYYLKDKVLLITGSSGIAAATIKLALEQEARVFYIGVDQVSCQQLREELSKNEEVDYFVGDLTDPVNADEVVTRCVSRYGRIDGLFNVAGTSGRKYGDGPLSECTESGWSETIRVNLHTQYRMCRKVIAVMMKSVRNETGQRGVILNMSSILGVAPESKHFSAIAYATSKGGIITMTRTMAAYYAAEGIRINAIAPGLVATRMSARANTDAEVLSFVKEKQPLTGGIMEAKDIADAALFLLSEQSRVITGQTLIADAGWSIS